MAKVRVEPVAARFEAERTAEGVRIRLLRRWGLYRAFVVVFTTVWLGGWAAGEVAAIGTLLGEDWLESGDGSGDRAFIVVWLVFWTLGGALVWYAWLWNVAGQEWVEARGDALSLRRRVGPFTREREYDARHVQDLRASQPGGWAQYTGLAMLGVGAGTLAFDYGSRTVRFADGIEEAEAKQVAAVLDQHRAPAREGPTSAGTP